MHSATCFPGPGKGKTIKLLYCLKLRCDLACDFTGMIHWSDGNWEKNSETKLT